MARHGKPLKGKKSTGDREGDESPTGIVNQGVPSKTGLRAVPAVSQLLWSERNEAASFSNSEFASLSLE